MRFELTTFSLARRHSTTELRPHGQLLVLLLQTILHVIRHKPITSCGLREVDPVGFEPTIFSLQRRRLPARPRALTPIHKVPTRGLEPPHLAVIDPKSIASAIPPRRRLVGARTTRTTALYAKALRDANWRQFDTPDSVYAVICLNHSRWLAAGSLPGVTWPRPHRCDEIAPATPL
jgi:hypothetical protein